MGAILTPILSATAGTSQSYNEGIADPQIVALQVIGN